MEVACQRGLFDAVLQEFSYAVFLAVEAGL